MGTAPFLFAAPGAVVISQVYGGGGNTGATYKNDFIELFNRSSEAVDLSTWSVQYASAGGGAAWQVTRLTGTIQPGQYFLVRESAGAGGTVNLPTPDVLGVLALSATAGKVALVNNQTVLYGACPTAGVVDLVGFGAANCSETAPTPTLSNTTAALRLAGGCSDTGANSVDFTVGPPTPRNSAITGPTCEATVPPAITGAASPNKDEAGYSTLLTATVTPGSKPASTGLAVKADLSSIGGSPTQTLYDDGTHGDRTAGDNVFSYTAAITTALPGAKALALTVTDAQSRTASTTVTFTVIGPAEALAIHEIQGAGLVSPHVGEYVVTTGIVTALKPAGFFLQAVADAYDDNPSTSEAVYVYTSGAPPAEAQVGNRVEVKGDISEYYALTEIALKHLALLSSGNALPPAVPLTSAELNPAGTTAHLEPLEGMRVRADSLKSVGPTDGQYYASTGTAKSYGEFYAVLGGASRTFREPGIQAGTPVPAGLPANVPVFDGNPERVRVDTAALTGATALDVTSGTEFPNVTGVLDYAFGSYAILPEGALTPVGGMTAVPVPVPGAREFTVATFNLQQFTTVVELRMSKVSHAIREVLRAPDIVGVQEVKDLATLQLLADRINADARGKGDPDPGYAAYLVNYGDMGVGFLVRSARVQDLNYAQEGAGLTFPDPRDGRNQILNDRPPLVLTAKLLPPEGQPYPVTIIVSHLRSLIDVEDTTGLGDFVRLKRKLGAEYLAGLIAQHQAAGENVVAVGDYNAFEFNDGYVDVTGTAKGAPTASDQVLLASTDLLDPDMVDLITTLPENARYTYVENGNAQVLDHILASASVLVNGYRFVIAHNNADFPEVLRNDPDRPERASDHDIPVAYFTFPPLKADLAVTMTAAYTTVLSGAGQTYTIAMSNAGPDAAHATTMLFTPPAHSSVAGVSAPAGWSCNTGQAAVSCQSTLLPAGGSAQFTISLNVDCATPNGTVLTARTDVSSTTLDPQTADNAVMVSTTVSNPAPEIVSLAANPATLGPPNHKLVPVTLSYRVTDNCDTSFQPVVTISSDQPVNGVGDGNTAFDWTVVDSHHVLLRAERAPTASGRTYTVTITVKDSAQKQTSKSVQVKVAR